MKVSDIIKVFGNGDEKAGLELLSGLAYYLSESCKEHPHFAISRDHGLEILNGEISRLNHSILKHPNIDENPLILMIVASMIRFYRRDWLIKHQ